MPLLNSSLEMKLAAKEVSWSFATIAHQTVEIGKMVVEIG